MPYSNKRCVSKDHAKGVFARDHDHERWSFRIDHQGASLPSGELETGKQSSKRALLLLGIRLFLGGVLAYASVDKILHPAAFAEAVYNYRILPDGLVNLTAILVPWLELLVGGCLIFGMWLPGSLFLCNLLLGTFFSALLFNVARGLDIHCGCFSTSAQDSSGSSLVWYLFRDGIFLLLGGYLFFQLFLNKRQTVHKTMPD